MENFAKQLRTKRKLILAILMLTVIFPASLFMIKPASAVATYTDNPVAGWASTRLNDTKTNSTAPGSVVFPGQKASFFEQQALREAGLGYNTIRASFAPYCSLFYGLQNLNSQFAPSTNFMGDYSAANLTKAINIARYLNFWIIVDYHGYDDLYNSTTLTCWRQVWFGSNAPNWISGQNGIVGQFKNNYTRIIWEPLNEPYGPSFPVNRTAWCGANYNQCDGNKTTYLSSAYQNWTNTDRTMGDTHSIVIQNLCSNSCQVCASSGNGDCAQAVNDYPTVNDTQNGIFISLHSYMSNLNNLDQSQGGPPNLHLNCYATNTCYTNSTADLDAQLYYNTTVAGTSRTGWPALNTEGGAFLSSGVRAHIPPQDIRLSGSSSYSNITFHFIQTLTSLYDSHTPQRIPFTWWGADWWTTYECHTSGVPCTGTYGILSSAECSGGVCTPGWGTLLNHQNFSVFGEVAPTSQTSSELTVPESEQRTFQNPRGMHGYYVFYRASINSVQSCYYAFSPDGSGWNNSQSIGLSSLYDSCSVTYAQDQSNQRLLVYFVVSRHSTSVGTGHNVYFRIGSIADNLTAISWITNLQLVNRTSTSTENFAYPVIAQDSNGYLHVAFSYTNYSTSSASAVENVEVCSSKTTYPSSNPTWYCSIPQSSNPFPEETAANIATPIDMPHILPIASGVLIIKGVCSGAENSYITCTQAGSDFLERSTVMTWNGSTQTWGNTASFSFSTTTAKAHVRTSVVNATGSSYRVQYVYEDGGNLTTRYIDSPYTSWSSATDACTCGTVFGAHLTHVSGSHSTERFIIFYSTNYLQLYSVNSTDSTHWSSAQLEFINGVDSDHDGDCDTGCIDANYPTSASSVVETSPNTVYIPVAWVQAFSSRQIWFDKRPLN